MSCIFCWWRSKPRRYILQLLRSVSELQWLITAGPSTSSISDITTMRQLNVETLAHRMKLNGRLPLERYILRKRPFLIFELLAQQLGLCERCFGLS